MLYKVACAVWLSVFMGCMSSAFAKVEYLDIVTEDYPPFQIVEENGEVSGEYAEQVRKLLDLANIPYRIRVLPWARAYRIAKDKPNTCIFSIVKETFREKSFLWVSLLGSTVGTFYTSKEQVDNVKLTSIEDAYNYVIAVQRHGVTTELLQRRGFLFQHHLLDVTDWHQSIHLVEKGRANLVVSNKAIIEYYLKELGMPLDTLVPLIDYVDISDAKQYLACNLQTDPDYIERIRRADKAIKREG